MSPPDPTYGVGAAGAYLFYDGANNKLTFQAGMRILSVDAPAIPGFPAVRGWKLVVGDFGPWPLASRVQFCLVDPVNQSAYDCRVLIDPVQPGPPFHVTIYLVKMIAGVWTPIDPQAAAADGLFLVQLCGVQVGTGNGSSP